jgi:hypothetical protein
VQVDPAALPLDVIDLALAVVLAASLERQQLRIPRRAISENQLAASPPFPYFLYLAFRHTGH